MESKPRKTEHELAWDWDVMVFKEEILARQEEIKRKIDAGEIEPACGACGKKKDPDRLHFPSDFSDVLVCWSCSNLDLRKCNCGEVLVGTTGFKEHYFTCDTVPRCETCGGIMYAVYQWFGKKEFCMACPSPERDLVHEQARIRGASKFINELRQQIRGY